MKSNLTVRNSLVQAVFSFESTTLTTSQKRKRAMYFIVSQVMSNSKHLNMIKNNDNISASTVEWDYFNPLFSISFFMDGFFLRLTIL